MKWLTICLALALSAGGISAQTNGPVRQLSLREAIEMALQHNLDIRIERVNPQISLYDLSGAYASYDPTFTFRGEHEYGEAGSRMLGGGFSIPGSQQESDTFNTGLNGLLPWGMTYNLGGYAQDVYGNSFRLNTNTFSTEPVPYENSQANWGLNITQPLLKNFWNDATRLNIRLSKNRLKISEQALRLRIMTVVGTTEQTYYNLIGAREQVVTQEKALELATRLLEENRKRVEVGALAPLDEKQAESQAASSRATLLEVRNLVSIQEHSLKNLISDDYATLAGTTLVPSDSLKAERQFFSRQDSWSKGLAERPELIQARLNVQNAGLEVKYRKNQLLPQVDVFGSLGYNGSGDEFSDSIGDAADANRPRWSVGGQLTIPLMNTGARADHRSSKAREQQVLLTLKRIEQQIMTEIDDNIAEAQSSFQRVEATRAASEYAEAALQAEQKKLESGKSTSFLVLQLQRDLTMARYNETRALADYNRALAALSLSEGMTLQRYNINLEIK